MIRLIRSDERLIHGQCMQFIVSDYSIRRIIVVDDMTANNPLLRSIFQNAVPAALTADVYTIEQSLPEIRNALTDNVSTLLLMKNPRTLIPLMDQIREIPMQLNIGPQMARNGIKCVDYATLHPEDIEACKKLTERGVKVYFNAIGAAGSVIEWSTVAKKLS